MQMGRRFAPVKVGDELNVKIEAVGEKGDGIAKKDGFVLFVPGTSKDQEVKIRVTRVLKNVGFAEVAGAGSAPKQESDNREESYSSEERSGSGEEPQDYQQEENFDSEDFGEEDNN
ncbi:TRAM domain-containing protein [Candidatus Woesearchaeota archaeon]|nr:TRAM domain-containing protein [Candidatus Woesearchaeota archaeon]